jgi:hypothetical protein
VFCRVHGIITYNYTDPYQAATSWRSQQPTTKPDLIHDAGWDLTIKMFWPSCISEGLSVEIADQWIRVSKPINSGKAMFDEMRRFLWLTATVQAILLRITPDGLERLHTQPINTQNYLTYCIK